jgi:hypothetical protein
MRRHDDIGKLKDGLIRVRRFLRKNIQSGAAETALEQGVV